ncbi:MAG: hypothetical protein JW819_04550 [Candidatus Krumholzibacteriota bacterium]|nr:hypothetical protein [Candidatus Krumholzibacteriota bacterium]
MTIPILAAGLADPSAAALQLVLDITLKGSLICALAGLAALALRRHSAYARNLVWAGALAALLLLPLGALVSPVWRLDILPELEGIAALPAAPALSGLDAAPADAAVAAGEARAATRAFWMRGALAAWLAGALLTAAWYLLGRLELRRRLRRARRLDGDWRRLGDSLGRELGLARPVPLLASSGLTTAITVGAFRPCVVLPAAADAWPDGRRRCVLYHELAHVRRRDGLVELMAVLARACHWFNPLVWWTVRQLHVERERDCDNAVLNGGAKPSDYALQLMEIAADLGGGAARPAWQLSGISQGANLKDRLLHILDPSIQRRTGGRRVALATAVLFLAMVLPLSASGIWRSRPDTKKGEKVVLPAGDMAILAADAESSAWNSMLKKGEDPVLKMAQVIEEEGLDVAVAFYHDLRAKKGGEVFKEMSVNALGYRLLHVKRVKEALAVFTLNTEAYPEAWNVWDSLGECHMIIGNLPTAIEYYEQSLTLGSENEKKAKLFIEQMRASLAEETS